MPPTEHGDIIVNLARLMEERGITNVTLAEAVGISTVNLSRLKNGHVQGIRWDTLAGICTFLKCQPGDIIEHKPEEVAISQTAADDA